MKKLWYMNIVQILLIGPTFTAVYNAPCYTNHECRQSYTDLYICEQNHCIRKPFTFDNPREWLGSIIIVLVSMFANAGGLGAGAVIIPVYIFVYGFAPTDSIPQSKITIFAGAIASVMVMWNQKRDDNKGKFQISYEMATAMIPLLLCGTMIGVLLSKFLPPAVVTAGLVSYLLYSTYKMFFKAIEVSKKENIQRTLVKSKEFSIKADTTQDMQSPKNKYDNVNPSSVTLEGNMETSGNRDGNSTYEKDSMIDLEEFTTSEMLKKQTCNFFLLISSYFFVLVIALLRGGEGKESVIGLSKCSEGSWLLLFASQLLGVSLSIMAFQQNKHIYNDEDAIPNDSKHQDYEKNLFEFVEKQRLRKKIQVMSYFTGIAAGTLGIGGGMILGPFMQAMGMDPTLSTALSGFTVLFTSSSTTSQFMIAGAIHQKHAWVLMIFSLIGSFIGNQILKRLIKKYNRPSLVIWVIFGILSLACLVLPAQTIYNAFVKKGAFTFGGLC